MTECSSMGAPDPMGSHLLEAWNPSACLPSGVALTVALGLQRRRQGVVHSCLADEVRHGHLHKATCFFKKFNQPSNTVVSCTLKLQ